MPLWLWTSEWSPWLQLSSPSAVNKQTWSPEAKYVSPPPSEVAYRKKKHMLLLAGSSHSKHLCRWANSSSTLVRHIRFVWQTFHFEVSSFFVRTKGLCIQRGLHQRNCLEVSMVQTHEWGDVRLRFSAPRMYAWYNPYLTTWSYSLFQRTRPFFIKEDLTWDCEVGIYSDRDPCSSPVLCICCTSWKACGKKGVHARDRSRCEKCLPLVMGVTTARRNWIRPTLPWRACEIFEVDF